MGEIATLEQTLRMAESLYEIGVEPMVVEDTAGRPLAVAARALAPEVAAAYAPPHTGPFYVDGKIGLVLPYGEVSKCVYPAEFTNQLDAVVQAAIKNPEARAVDLKGHEFSALNLWGPEAGAYEVGDAGPHVDRPNAEDTTPADQLHGLNPLLALQGLCRVHLSLAPDFEILDQLRSDVEAAIAQHWNRLAIDDVITQCCGRLLLSNPRAEIEMEPGMALYFQAERHQSRGLLPLVHMFTSMTTDRCSIPFTPSWAAEDKVLPIRRQHIEQYDLSALGYAA